MSAKDTKIIEYNIHIECDLTAGAGGERWDVVDVYDQSDRSEIGDIGDIGVYEFDAYSDFPGTLMEAVLTTLGEVNIFSEEETLYSIRVEIYYGGSRLGLATQRFFGRDFTRR